VELWLGGRGQLLCKQFWHLKILCIQLHFFMDMQFAARCEFAVDF